VQRLVESEVFALAWANTPSEKQKEVEAWIYLGDVTLIEKWIEKARLIDLEVMSLRQLRSKASELGVPYYGRLTKIELIWGISNALESRNDSADHHDEGNNAAFGSKLGQDFGEVLQHPVHGIGGNEQYGTQATTR